MTRDDLKNFLDIFAIFNEMVAMVEHKDQAEVLEAAHILRLLIYFGNDDDFAFALKWASRFAHYLKTVGPIEYPVQSDIAFHAAVLGAYVEELKGFVASKGLEWPEMSATSAMPTPQTDAKRMLETDA